MANHKARYEKIKAEAIAVYEAAIADAEAVYEEAMADSETIQEQATAVYEEAVAEADDNYDDAMWEASGILAKAVKKQINQAVAEGLSTDEAVKKAFNWAEAVQNKEGRE